MRRRGFIAALGGALALPLAARAQKPSLPVIGFININPEVAPDLFSNMRQGLAEVGIVEGRDVTFEYRFDAQSFVQPERLVGLVSDLVQRGVAVIVTYTVPQALAAKAVTNSIPIISWLGPDPVATGLVASLNRPGGNLTGAAALFTEIAAKRLELLRELAPTATSIACLTNPTNKVAAETETNALQVAARTLGIHLLVLNASKPAELEAVFAGLSRDSIGGVVVGSDILFLILRDQLFDLAARYKMPAIYTAREFTAAGGLMSYGTHIPDGFHIIGVYAGRVLKGEKPADLPVQQVTKTELAVNLKTAKALGLEISPTLLARADEVFE
jgi:putative ABC transport system substrate-binding protein